MTRSGFRCLPLLAMIALLPAGAWGQVPFAAQQGQQSPEPETRIGIEVLAPPGYTDGLTLQRWAQLLNELGANPRMRTGRGNERPEASERSAGRLREISIRGVLDSRRRLHVPGRVFMLDDRAEIATWLDELREFGVQGSPEGQPLWGLSEAQFRELFAALSEPAPAMQPASALQVLIDLREATGLPIELAPTAAEQLRARVGAVPAAEDPGPPPPPPDPDGAGDVGAVAPDDGPALSADPQVAPVAGLSLGTSLAHFLNRHDLAFRPQRHRDGAISLQIVPLADCPDAWPAGWPPPEGRMIDHLPRLFELVSVEIDRVPLDDVLAQLGERLDLPILYDEAALRGEAIDPHQVLVTHERRRATWNRILQRVAASNMLLADIRTDEAGRFFVWITTAHAAREAALR